MTIPVWAGGAVATLFFAYASMLARRWWPAAWLVCIFFAAGTGLILGLGGSSAAGLWWTFWAGYTPTLPIMRLALARSERRRREEERQYRLSALMVDLDRGARAARDGWHDEE